MKSQGTNKSWSATSVKAEWQYVPLSYVACELIIVLDSPRDTRAITDSGISWMVILQFIPDISSSVILSRSMNTVTVTNQDLAHEQPTELLIGVGSLHQRGKRFQWVNGIIKY